MFGLQKGYNKACGKRCTSKLFANLRTVMDEYDAAGDGLVRKQYSSRVFNDTFAPVLHAILDSCGERQGLQIAEYAAQ